MAGRWSWPQRVCVVLSPGCKKRRKRKKGPQDKKRDAHTDFGPPSRSSHFPKKGERTCLSRDEPEECSHDGRKVLLFCVRRGLGRGAFVCIVRASFAVSLTCEPCLTFWPSQRGLSGLVAGGTPRRQSCRKVHLMMGDLMEAPSRRGFFNVRGDFHL